MMRTLSLVAVVSLLGCDPAGPNNNEPGEPRLVTDQTPGVAEVASGNQSFAVDLYGELPAEGNLFFSPFSISAALGMTWSGSGGDTAAELGSSLQAQLAEPEWAAAFGSLVDDLNGDKGRGYDLFVANRVFGQPDFGWDQGFVDRLENDWRAPLEDADFMADPEASRERVNEWVEEQTQSRIQDLLPEGSVTVDTRMVLANAVYFKADWLSQFDPELTREEAFTLADGSSVQTDMMLLDSDGLQDAAIRVRWDDDVIIGRIPYVDDEVAMYIVLPNAHDGLAAVEAGMTSEVVQGWVDAVGTSGHDDAIIKLPKLEISWKENIIPRLQALGVGQLFDPVLANLDPMTGSENNLFVTGVFHQAWMKMDEVGTEAAAATGVVVGDESAGAALIAQHPFLFFIRDDLSGSILFMGRVADPTAG